jgi:hypothetical protein
MVSITLSVPKETRELMKKFSEINWSQFIRKSIESKTKELSFKEEMLNRLKLEDNKGFTDWTIELSKEARKNRFKELKSKGLL